MIREIEWRTASALLDDQLAICCEFQAEDLTSLGLRGVAEDVRDQAARYRRSARELRLEIEMIDDRPKIPFRRL